MALEHIALIDFRLAFDAVPQVGRLFLLRHLPGDLVETGLFLANRRVGNALSNGKLEWHGIPSRLDQSHAISSMTMRTAARRFSCCRIDGCFSPPGPACPTARRSPDPALRSRRAPGRRRRG